ncbi:hypothetical protein SK128_008230 [Halocaridina rubra]|uniref:VWFD domain-containing protein n=1 Tax=Halocaridina rubra TaxID=373956 RepID=A0AAN9AFX0_HALRR
MVTLPEDDFSNTFPLGINGSHKPACQFKIQQKYLEASEYLNEQFEAVRDKVIAVLVEYLEAFKAYAANNIVFDYINVITGNAYDQLLLVWNRWRHEARTDLDTLERITFSLADWAEELLKERNYLRDELYVWEPEDYGKVEYSLPLPLKWKSFIDPPDWHPITRIFLKQSPAMAAERTLFEGVHTLAIGLGAFNMQGSMMPPFTGTATIFGQHVTTFDLHHYHFLGSCTYLLAKDFVGNEFEVVGDYKREDHGSIHLHSLTVRGPNMEVVLYVDGTIVIRNPGSAETQCRGDFCAVKMDDMFVTCNRQTRGCSITVSGKYFGRISGLLGNYNYEPSDDQVGPDGSRARHAAEMGRMWALSSDTCYQGNQVISVRNLHEAEEVDLCRRIFLSSSSPLSYCFVEVDPRPYFQHCIKDHGQADFGLSLYNTPCDAVAAYRTQCSSREIHLSVPDECQEESSNYERSEHQAAQRAKELWARISFDDKL